MDHYKSIGSPLGTAFLANITEHGSSIDQIQHLFICVALTVFVHTFLA